jgi:hypothetical protein
MELSEAWDCLKAEPRVEHVHRGVSGDEAEGELAQRRPGMVQRFRVF